MEQIYSSNIINLAVVWIGLFAILKTPIRESFAAYKKDESDQRNRLEDLFLNIKKTLYKNKVLKTNSSNFVNITQNVTNKPVNFSQFVGPPIIELVPTDSAFLELLRNYK